MADLRCRRCLLRDLAGAQDLYESVRAYRSDLPEDDRTGDDAFASRLDTCRECRYLQNATCMQCGCYVEIRAARVSIHCPMGKW